MKRRVQVIHEDQDRSLENGDQRGINTVSKKGNTQGYMETEEVQGRGKDEVKMRRGQGCDEDEVRTRVRMKVRARTRTRTIE